MANGGGQLVWYAAYGSNLSTARFRCYLEGGRPVGATRTYELCPHGATFLDTRPVAIDRQLQFGRRSITWDGGGVAFLGHEPSPRHRTLGRVYLLELPQLAHVARQENRLGRDDDADLIAWELLREQLPSVLPMPASRYYNVLLPLGELEGRPIVTLTGPAGAVPPNRPSPPYRDTIVQGLRETWPALSEAEIDEYLAAAGAPVPAPDQT